MRKRFHLFEIYYKTTKNLLDLVCFNKTPKGIGEKETSVKVQNAQKEKPKFGNNEKRFLCEKGAVTEGG